MLWPSNPLLSISVTTQMEGHTGNAPVCLCSCFWRVIASVVPSLFKSLYLFLQNQKLAEQTWKEKMELFLYCQVNTFYVTSRRCNYCGQGDSLLTDWWTLWLFNLLPVGRPTCNISWGHKREANLYELIQLSVENILQFSLLVKFLNTVPSNPLCFSTG